MLWFTGQLVEYVSYACPELGQCCQHSLHACLGSHTKNVGCMHTGAGAVLRLSQIVYAKVLCRLFWAGNLKHAQRD